MIVGSMSLAITRRRADVGLMLGQRRRRWCNVKPTYSNIFFLVFVGSLSQASLKNMFVVDFRAVKIIIRERGNGFI